MNGYIKTASVISLCTTLLACVLFSCESQPSIVSEAERAATTALVSDAPETLKTSIASMTTAYSSDSLVILRLKLRWKTLLNEDTDTDLEYVYLTYGGKKYWASQELRADSLFRNPQAYESEKQGTLYQNLSYDEGMYYKAVLFINKNGEVVGSEDEEKPNIPNPIHTGNWELKYYVDDFGEPTSESYLSLKAEGTFSNSATTGSELTVYLRVDDGKAYLKLYEYGSFTVDEDDFFTFRVKDSGGNISEFRWFNARSSGIIFCDDELEPLLAKEGEIAFSGVYQNRYTSPHKYLFKINADGYNEAKRICRELRSN